MSLSSVQTPIRANCSSDNKFKKVLSMTVLKTDVLSVKRQREFGLLSLRLSGILLS
uniref:Uncharacterized protein n=1 Tax=Octopus bimaculoides TaxID=37653 RepID=A0A0L8I0T2_OCTBM